MPKLQTETIGGGDQTWLGSAHGIWNCRTATLDISAFTAGTHYPDGHIPSGTPLATVGGLAVPYNAGGSGGAQNLTGFLFTDQPVNGTADIPAPVLDHGRVVVANLPTAFTAPAATADKTTCVYV